MRDDDPVTSTPASPPPGTAPDVLDDLQWRGLIAQTTDLEALRRDLRAGPVTLYCGFDPTAPSLHVGNLVQILVLRRLQLAGHRPLALVGGATGLIGDPKPTAERRLNDADVVAGWVERIRAQIQPYLSFDGDNAALMVDNLDWTATMSAIDLLREVGRHFRVGRMLSREAVSARLHSDEGISYTEFSYQVLQGMDYLELFRRHGCTLQTGGSDQWGNLTAGTELIRKATGASAHALATTLLVKADGTKFGKTETGTVWLDPALTSPYAFFQFWLAADDRDVAHVPEDVQLPVQAGPGRPGARDGGAAPGARRATGAGGGAHVAGARPRAGGARPGSQRCPVRQRRLRRPRRGHAARRAGGGADGDRAA